MTTRVLPRLLFDTNVILDVMVDRDPWSHDAVRLLDAVQSGQAAGFIAAHGVTTVHFMMAKKVGHPSARQSIRDLVTLLQVVTVDHALIQQALALDMTDFEDAVQSAAAIAARVDGIVTRNLRDFRGSPIPAMPAIAARALLDLR
jgi:predicted nucleic acid-binding protein